MRPNPMKTYAQVRCALTAQLRFRAQHAEAEMAAMRAEMDALRAAHAEELDRVRAERAAEAEAAAARKARDAGPEGERERLLLARDRVRAELVQLATTHKSCKSCGSFGRDFSKRFLQAEIDALTEAHGLPSVPPLPDPDWPTPKGYGTRHGKRLDDSWLTEPPQPKREQSGEVWRPPHWHDVDRTGLSGMYGDY